VNASFFWDTTEWSQHVNGSIEVDGELVWEVGFWAVRPVVTSFKWMHTAVVEATEPMGAVISSERPLAHPEWVLSGFCSIRNILIIILASFSDSVRLTPGLIDVGIHNDVLHIIIGEHVVPVIIEPSVMENELSIWSVLLLELSGALVPVFQEVEDWVGLRLVQWLESIESWMVTPSLEQVLMNLESSREISMVDWIISPGICMPSTPPFALGGSGEVVLVLPVDDHDLAAIIVAVLRIFDGVEIHKDLDTVFVCGIIEPLDLVSSSVHAPNIWAIWVKSPVTDWKSDDLNSFLCELLEVILSEPSIPMCSHELVSFYCPESLTESIGVHSSVILILTKESVKERRSDPRFEDHPTSSVGSCHCLLAGLGEAK